VLLAASALAVAQPTPAAVACRPTETQAECHARLKCKANEELDDCKKRLLRCRANEDLEACERRVGAGNAGPRDGADARDRDADRDRRERDDSRDDRDDDRRDRDDDRDDRGDRRDRDDDDRGRDRDRDDRGSQRRRRSGGRRARGDSRGFEANKTFGLGLEVGEPTGLTGKYFVSDSTALDFGVGWIYSHYYYGDGVHLYGDFLWHPTSLVSAAAFEMPFYVGLGLRYWDFDYCDNRVCTYDGSAIGLRIPVGIAFDFNNVPLDIFAQLVPVIDFIDGDYYDRYGDRAHLGVDLSLGIRFSLRDHFQGGAPLVRRGPQGRFAPGRVAEGASRGRHHRRSRGAVVRRSDRAEVGAGEGCSRSSGRHCDRPRRCGQHHDAVDPREQGARRPDHPVRLAVAGTWTHERGQ